MTRSFTSLPLIDPETLDFEVHVDGFVSTGGTTFNDVVDWRDLATPLLDRLHSAPRFVWPGAPPTAVEAAPS